MNRCFKGVHVFAKVQNIPEPANAPIVLVKYFGKSESQDPIKMLNEIKIPAAPESVFLIENITN